MFETSLNLLVLLFLVFFATCKGIVLNKIFGFKYSDRMEHFVLSYGLGLVYIIFSTTALAFLGFLKSTYIYIFIFFSSFSIFFVKSIVSTNHYEKYDYKSPLKEYLLPFSILIFIWIIYLLSALTPPLDGDSIIGYLDVPRRYVNAAGIIQLPYEIFSSLPLNMQMLSSFSIALHNDILAVLVVGFGMSFCSTLIVIILSKKYFNLKVALWAALLFITTHSIQFLVAGAKVNLGRSFFDLLAIYSFLEWANGKNGREDKWFILTGVFSGTAFGIHYQSAFISLMISMIIIFLIYYRNPDKPFNKKLNLSLSYISAYSILILFLASPWLIKNYYETGNPLYPILNNFFIPSGNSFIASLQFEGDLNILSFLWKVSTDFTYLGYGKPLGPLFLILLPGLFFLKPLPKKIYYLIIILALLYSMWYLFSVHRMRHFLSEIGILSVLCGWIMSETKLKYPFVYKTIFIGFLMYFIFEISFYSRLHFFNISKLDFIIGKQNREQFLERNLNKPSRAYPNWSITNYINNLSDSTTVISMYVGNDYYIKPHVNFIDSRIVDLTFFNEPDNNEDSIIYNWKKVNADYLFINKNYLEIPYSFRLEDCRIILSNDFKKKYLTLVYENNSQELYKINF